MKKSMRASTVRAPAKGAVRKLKAKSRLTKNNLDVKIQLVSENPKQPGSECYQRYTQYCQATTIREALYLGVTKADLKWDEKFGFMKRAKDRQVNAKEPIKGRIMGGIVKDGGLYISERYFCGLGIQARANR